MSFNVGLNLVEVDGKAAPSIQPAATSVAGFVIKSARGVSGDKPVRITNWSQFLERFGGIMDGAYGAHALRGFLDNGGTTAYVTRVLNTDGAAPEPATLESDPEPFALTPGAAVTFVSGETATFNATPARTPGGTNTDVDLTGHSIQMVVNDVDRGTHVFDPALDVDFHDIATATPAEIAAVLNREFSGIRALVDGGALVVRTDRQGNGAKLEITETPDTDPPVLDLDAAVPGTGNVGDIEAVTAAEAKAVFEAAFAAAGTAHAVEVDGDVFRITHPTDPIQVDAASSAAVAPLFGFDTDPHPVVPSAASQVPATAASKVFGGLTVEAGRLGSSDPGAWGNALRIKIEEDTPNAIFDLTVMRDDEVLETRVGLTMETAEDVVNDEFTGSKFIKVTVDSTGGLPGDQSDAQLDDVEGRNGSFADPMAEAGAYAGAFARFDKTAIQLLCCPESNAQTVIIGGLDHCAKHGDRMYIGHTPQNHDAGNAEIFVKTNNLQGKKRYGALYFPWIDIALPNGRPHSVPPDGHVAGVYARIERERGIWKAPAGIGAGVRGALRTRFDITNVEHTALVKQGSVNAIRAVPGQGIIIDSSRTLSTDTPWLYVNVRLLFNFVKSSLLGGLRWAVQEPNDDTLWNKVKFNSVTPFLMGLWRRGAFGPGSPEEVFTVKVDAENNLPEDIQQGKLTIEVYFYPSRPAETIVIIVGQQEGGGSASEG